MRDVLERATASYAETLVLLMRDKAGETATKLKEQEMREGQFPVNEMHGYTPEEAKAEYAKFERKQEHQRLKDAVVAAAKADMLSEIRQAGDNGIDRMIAARRAYRAAVQALLEFESSSTKENK